MSTNRIPLDQDQGQDQEDESRGEEGREESEEEGQECDLIDPTAVNAAVSNVLSSPPDSDEKKREQLKAMYLAGFHAAAQVRQQTHSAVPQDLKPMAVNPRIHWYKHMHRPGNFLMRKRRERK